MGLTQWFNLRKPTDPQAPADLITIVGALADDTDAALKGVQAAAAPAAHTHQQQVEVVMFTFAGALAAGQTKSMRFGRDANYYPTVSSLHASSNVTAGIESLDPTGFTVRIRNWTASTTYNDVKIIAHLVRDDAVTGN
jgi:hypothetical protein